LANLASVEQIVVSPFNYTGLLAPQGGSSDFSKLIRLAHKHTISSSCNPVPSEPSRRATIACLIAGSIDRSTERTYLCLFSSANHQHAPSSFQTCCFSLYSSFGIPGSPFARTQVLSSHGLRSSRSQEPRVVVVVDPFEFVHAAGREQCWCIVQSSY